MKIHNLSVQFKEGGIADINLPGAYIGIRGKGGCYPDELDEVVFLTQVHGARILIDPEGSEEADGMILSDRGRAAGIRTADCLPVFIKSRGYTAAFHAGWKGLAEGIAGRMIDLFPEDPELVVLGNCICDQCYNVGEDVREQLLGTASSPLHPHGRIDLKKLAVDQMVSAGLGDECAVFSVPECTKCRQDIFYSYRYNGTGKRNLQWIQIKK